jgi:hypothetical protein
MSIPTRITITHLKNVLVNAGTQVNTPLGRWSSHINKNKNKNTGLIADYSNEDHCGTCGDYIISKRNNVKNIHTSNSDITMIGNTDTLYIMEYSSMMLNTPH